MIRPINKFIREWWWAVLVAIAAVALRLRQLGGPEFWYDEAFTVLVARLDLAALIKATAGDVHPPLYYLFVWLLRKVVGESEFWIRLPSVLMSLAAIPVLIRILLRLNVNKVAVAIVAGIMAISPLELYFAQEARMYALVQLAFLLAVLGILERRWWVVCLANGVLMWTHNYALFYLPILGVLALYRERRLGWWLLAWIGPVVSWIPWAMVLARQMGYISTGYWIDQTTLGNIIYSVMLMFWYGYVDQFYVAMILVTIGGLAYGAWSILRRKPVWALPVVWLAAAIFIIPLAVEVVWKPIWLWRAMIVAAPFLYTLLVEPLSHFTGWRRLYLLCIYAPMVFAGIIGYHDYKSQTTFVVNIIQVSWQPGDVIYAVGDGPWILTSVYKPKDYPIYKMPECQDEHDKGALTDQTRQALGADMRELDDITYQRAWVVWGWSAMTSQCNVDKAQKVVSDYTKFIELGSDDTVSSAIYLLEHGHLNP